jgi:hypothetical protein
LLSLLHGYSTYHAARAGFGAQHTYTLTAHIYSTHTHLQQEQSLAAVACSKHSDF